MPWAFGLDMYWFPGQEGSSGQELLLRAHVSRTLFTKETNHVGVVGVCCDIDRVFSFSFFSGSSGFCQLRYERYVRNKYC